ncbi:hypothetical protein [Salinibacter ruber]|uniref:hypothetical protein n=1 Tax=Salinibacter ruber TaxID=146919 RepID=UPI002167BBB0|nr:hypothetical protein [Salinibacter ruber]
MSLSRVFWQATSEKFLNQRGKNGAQLIETAIADRLHWQIEKPLQELVLRVSGSPADGCPIFGEVEHVNRKHLSVGRCRGGVVALPLCYGSKPVSVALADEQVDPKWHGGSVNAVKGGCLEGCSLHLSPSRLRQRAFFNP